VLALTALMAPPASAQSEPTPDGNLPGHFTLTAGALFGANLDTKLRLDSRKNDLGTTIDLEDVLGLKSQARSFEGQVTWQIQRHHRLAVGYYGLQRSNTKRLSRDIDLGDTTWTVGADVSASFNTAYATFGYRWSPILTSRVRLGVGLGVPVVFFSTALTARTSVIQVTARRKEELTVPIPLPGLNATVRLARCLYLDGQAQYLKISVADVSTDVFNFTGNLHYYPLSALGVALGVHGDYSETESRTKSFTGKLRYDVIGGTVQLIWIP
jgi:hypothetical protein